MLDDNEICEEVVALLDRMDKFPEEFIDDRSLHSRWGSVMAQINREGDNQVFTVAELGVLREKVQGLSRLSMKKEILQNIMYGGENGQYGHATDTSSYYKTPLTPVAPVGTASGGTGSINAMLTSSNTGPSWIKRV